MLFHSNKRVSHLLGCWRTSFVWNILTGSTLCHDRCIMGPKRKRLSSKKASTSAKIARLSVPANRSRLRGSIESIKDGVGPMVYLMRRDIRAVDNWSLLRCQDESRSVRVAHIVEKTHPSYRLAWFYANGLEECQTDLKVSRIPLDIIESIDDLPTYLKEISASGLVADLYSLREYDLAPVIKLCDEIEIPCWEVDSYNIVPVWVASDKQEYAARTIRTKINNKLDEWLVDIPSITSNEKPLDIVKPDFQVNDFLMELYGKCDQPDIKFVPGGKAGEAAMKNFFGRISKFEKYRNDPTQDAVSGLSPWIRFGHLSKQRIALEIKQNTASHKTFLEELVIRGELAENYTFYNPNYDNLQGAPAFGIKTLNDHAEDKRDYVYTYQEFANAKTHDDLWNAAQRQLVNDGKMHGFMRMYWAKKVLEWSESPKTALQIGIKLNDTFSMDGRDPRGYVGLMWSMTGLHDQGWRERAIFGKVRYMNYDGCKRKFDIKKYIKKHRTIKEEPAVNGCVSKIQKKPAVKEPVSEDKDEPAVNKMAALEEKTIIDDVASNGEEMSIVNDLASSVKNDGKKEESIVNDAALNDDKECIVTSKDEEGESTSPVNDESSGNNDASNDV